MCTDLYVEKSGYRIGPYTPYKQITPLHNHSNPYGGMSGSNK